MILKKRNGMIMAIAIFILAILLPHGNIFAQNTDQNTGDKEAKTKTNNIGPTRLSPKFKLYRARADYQLISFEIAADLKSVSPQYMKKSGKVSKKRVVNLLFYQIDPDTLFKNNSAGSKTITIYGRKITRTERKVLEEEYSEEVMQMLRKDRYLMATGIKIVSIDGSTNTRTGTFEKKSPQTN